mmetsp:Transcript_12588/g.41495  ORF Transcript_12588/g.41495 Transcript_12588/m.41495 type:complete len:257 (+) Transcript_12588:88-858(+)
MGARASKEPPASAASASAAAESSSSSCPVPEEYRGKAVYNVYSQRVDGLSPLNNMPAQANQSRAPGQAESLSTERKESSIPKGGTGSNWLYPSAQMFYNALVRKGKADDVVEKDMATVVSVHNSMNEMTWKAVLQWERLHAEACPFPMLLRFEGRPHDLSPRARWLGLWGGPAPFDRHDWKVLRCGQEVRYIIDFYFDEAKAGTMDAFKVDARPALDSPEACLDRLKMNVYIAAAAVGLPCPITGDSGKIVPSQAQ